MNSTEKASVIEKVKHYGVRFIRLQFTDVTGILKNVAIPCKPTGEGA